MSNFNFGDLCVVVKPQGMEVDPYFNIIVGRYVVLSHPVECEPTDKWAPRWAVSGLPKSVTWRWAISEAALRKIPPAPMDRENFKELEGV